jgi:hypothetical protein
LEEVWLIIGVCTCNEYAAIGGNGDCVEWIANGKILDAFADFSLEGAEQVLVQGDIQVMLAYE